MKNLLALCFLIVSGFAITACAQTNGKMSSSSAELRDFDGIALGISADVYVSQGEYNVEVTGPEKSVDQVELNANGGTLGIGTKRGTRNWNSRGVKVYVTMPNLSSIAIGGSGDVKVKDNFNDMENLEISIGGSGNVEIAGKASRVEVSVAGSGDVDASGVDANRAEISIAGSGNVKVGEVDKLEVSIAGSGDVYYKGNPSVEKSVVGSGDVRKL
ncbi:head GIN domain-containing protein [Phaeodactylibacter xiamenensis]|uniref:head GIN domain-containing protein n=1 Tax=Phaeodactylibacter xiamenensis TaxID=1524460 RepID=UPI003CCBF97E